VQVAFVCVVKKIGIHFAGSHDNMAMSCKQMMSAYTGLLGSTPQHIISYLPLSHVAAQLLDLHLPMLLAACVLPLFFFSFFFHAVCGFVDLAATMDRHYAGCTVHFARPDALKGSLGDTLKAVRPTVFFGVPRVWEKFAEKMKSAGATTTGVKKSLVTWAKSVGLAQYRAAQVLFNPSPCGYCWGGFSPKHKSTFFLFWRQHGHAGPWFHAVAKALVFSKVRVALGLDRCALACTSAAPISRETLEFFGALDITIMEGYVRLCVNVLVRF
jgi:long-chain-fatty-acid--CoA ligase ACSBG